MPVELEGIMREPCCGAPISAAAASATWAAPTVRVSDSPTAGRDQRAESDENRGIGVHGAWAGSMLMSMALA
jgi:hypothetical protein